MSTTQRPDPPYRAIAAEIRSRIESGELRPHASAAVLPRFRNEEVVGSNSATPTSDQECFPRSKIAIQ